MMIRKAVLGAVAATLMGSSTYATAILVPPLVTIIGAGNRSCGQWTEDQRRNEPDKYIDQEWVEGFLTGYNSAGTNGVFNLGHGIDVPALNEWVTNYCSAHPLDTIAVAAAWLKIDLRKRRGIR